LVTPKDELAQPLDFQIYAYLRDLLGLLPSPRSQQGIQELLRLLTPTRDAEGSRLIRSRLVEWSATSAVSTALIVAQPVTAVDRFLVIEGFALTTNDATPRTGRLQIEESGLTYYQDVEVGVCSVVQPLVLRRRIVCSAVTDVTWEVRGIVDAITGGAVVGIHGWGWEFEIGEYQKLP